MPYTADLYAPHGTNIVVFRVTVSWARSVVTGTTLLNQQANDGAQSLIRTAIEVLEGFLSDGEPNLITQGNVTHHIVK